MAVVFHPAVGAPTRPRVSVCIANYNGEAMIVDCIESVLAQNSGAAIEILVHDDASTDASVMVLRQRYPQVRLILSNENVGFCIANNRMVETARGEYVLLLNNDAALFPDAVRELISVAECIQTPAILTVPQHDWKTGALVDRGCLLDPFYIPVPNLDVWRHDVAYVIGACLWIPRKTWHELGGFPEWFGSIAEDMYLCCAARLRAFPVRCIGASGYRHRQGASFGGNRIGNGRLRTRYVRRYLSERNRLAVLMVCMPTHLMWPWLFVHVATLVAEGLLLCVWMRTLRPWRHIYAPSLLNAWMQRPLLLELRRRKQFGRKIGLKVYFSRFTWLPRKLALLCRHGMPELQH